MHYLNFADNRSTADTVERQILAIDVSPSMETSDWPPTRLAAAQGASIALIQRKLELGLRHDQLGVVAFADRATSVVRPCTVGANQQSLIEAIGSFTVGSGTNIADALEVAGRMLVPWHSRIRRLMRDDQNRPKRIDNRVVLLTDGDHNGSGDPRRVSRSLKRNGVVIDCIGIGGNPRDVNEELLRAIASKDHRTGEPRYVFIGERGQLIQRFQQLAGRISR